MLLVQALYERAELRPEHALHRPRLRRDDVHLEPAEHDGALRRRGLRDQGAAVGERAQRAHMRQVHAGDRQPHRLGAGGEQQALVGHTRAVGEHDLARAHIDARHAGLQAQGYALVGVEVVAAQRHPFLGRAAGEVVLRQVRPVHRRRLVVAEHRQAAGVTRATQHLGRGEAGRAAADDDDLLRRIGCRGATSGRRLHLLQHDDLAVLPLRGPAVDRAQCRRTYGLAGAQAEARVVPRAAHRVPHHQPLGERPVVVAAGGTDGEELVAAAREQHVIVANVAGEHLPIGERLDRDALREIRSFVRHGRLPSDFVRLARRLIAAAA